MSDKATSKRKNSAAAAEKPNKKVKVEKKQIKATNKKLEEMSDDEEEESNDDWGSDSDSEEEEEEQGTEGEEQGTEGEENPLKTSSKESHAKQKKLKEERKMAKPNAEAIQSVKSVWERLRVKKGLTAAARKKLVDEAWKLSKPLVKDIALKHDTSRVVQTMVKYSDKPTRKEITNELAPIYYELATSSYGKYLIIKLLHYGSTETRNAICKALLSNGAARKLIRHVHGAYVLEDMYRYYASPKYRNYIVLEFFDISTSKAWRNKNDEDIQTVEDLLKKYPEKRPDVMSHAYKRLQAAVEKGSIGFNVIHAVMLQYAKNINLTTSERENFVDLLTEGFAEIVHTPEGSETASRVLAMATAKERKHLLKTLKEFGFQLASDDYGCFVLISLFETIDDTVLVRKVFADTFKEHMGGLLTSKAGRRAFLYLLLGPSSRYFSKDQIKLFDTINELKKTTSKKQDDARLAENLESFSPIMLETIQEYPRKMFEESVGSQTAIEVLLYASAGDKPAALEAVANTFKGDIFSEGAGTESIFSQPFVSRALKTLVQGGHWNNATKQVDQLPENRNPKQIAEFKTMLADAIEDEYIKEWATGDGAFVIVSLLESLDPKSKQYKRLMAGLTKNKKKIAAAAEKNKGSKMISEKI